jgi:hypothetical protein
MDWLTIPELPDLNISVVTQLASVSITVNVPETNVVRVIIGNVKNANVISYSVG